LLVKDHLSLTHLPFHLANAFLPPATARFGGAVTGEVSLETNAGKPQLQGVLHLDTLSFSIPYVGTSFRIESDTLHIQDNRLPWQDLRIIAPDGSQLSLDGEVRLNPHRRLEGNIRAHTTRFQCMDVKKNPYSTLYGQAYLGLDASAEGLLRALFVRGSITLLQDTELHYLMHNTTMPGMKLQPQDLVTFVNFSDTLSSWQTAPIPTLRLGGMNLQLEGLIDPTVAITLDLSSDGQSRVNVQGGGELTYTLDPQGDSRLMGRYTVQRGEVRYRPPLISEKVFSINPGSYLSWSGSIQDPTLHLTAVENLRVNVSGSGAGGSRTVLFQVIVSIRNTLETLSVTFDLTAPEDLTLQNQLASLTPEQRASQAMNLLVYNTYSVAGTTATTTSNPLNQFLQRELNRWAQNSLRGVDLSFGVNTYEANAQTGQTAHTDYSYRISKALFNHRLQAVIGGKYSTAPNAAENLRENLIDDFSIEYRLSKTQMLFLKLFMQSDYESILEGEVTETGLGFVVRKNGSRFGDLFRFFRSKADRVGAQP
ncbi:MAG: translocation/assembly module TamB domain-containing protein, partial [Alistipes sp.]|nr:translocation/assembly module TamB domain-containing protein [Alistipes sp.]